MLNLYLFVYLYFLLIISTCSLSNFGVLIFYLYFTKSVYQVAVHGRMMSTRKKKGRDTFAIEIFVEIKFKAYPFAEDKCLLGPLAFESHPEEKGDGERDEGGGNVHVRDRDLLPDHWPEKVVQ